MHCFSRTTDPYLARFAQADTIVPGGVQGYDRYAYVNNSPMRYIDPSGHANECSETVGGSCVYSKTSPGLNSGKADNEVDSGEVSVGAKPCNNCCSGPAIDSYGPSCMGPAPLEPIVIVAPWDFDRLSGWGVRFPDISGWIPWLPIIGGNVSVDVLYHFQSQEVSLNVNFSGLLGLGEGGSVGGGLIGIYDSESNADLLGFGSGGQFTGTPLIGPVGPQIAYSVSRNPGSNRKSAQLWEVGPAFLQEYSASFVGTLTIGTTLFNLGDR